ncbi:MAG TPA: ABC transporter permease [Microthrixaceae bacterium]|nr:ABC transporter permease [Microthrixaceae bacterium]HMT60684.1 ABC transporter permease [Microthrixaceae bacterium]
MSAAVAVARLGWREARRHRGRSLLVAAAVALPVCGLTVGLYGIDSTIPTREEAERIAPGLAGWAIQTPQVDRPLEERVSSALAALQAAAPAPEGEYVPMAEGQLLVTRPGGRIETMSVSAAKGDPRQAPTALLDRGRFPERAGEIAVAPRTITGRTLRLGDRLTTVAPERTLRVVGLASAHAGETNVIAWDEAVAQEAGRAAHPDRAIADAQGRVVSDLVVSGPAARRLAERQQRGDAVDLPDGVADGVAVGSTGFALIGSRLGVSTEMSAAAPRALAFTFAAFGMCWTGLVAAAALAVGVRRRRHDLGLLAANGAAPVTLRAAVLAEAAIIGASASVAGLGAGVALAHVLIPRWQAVAGVLPIPVHAATAPLLAAPLVGIAGALAAGAFAARGTTTASPIALLHGARSLPRAAPRVLLGGAIALATGLALLGLTRTSYEVSADGTYTADAAVITRGADAARAAAVALGVGGLVAVTTGAIRALRRWKIGGPSVRLAARDLSRDGVRAAAAAGALAATMAGWAAIAFTATPAIYPNEAPARTDVGLVATTLAVRADRLAAVQTPDAERAARELRDAGFTVGTARSVPIDLLCAPPSCALPEDAAYVSTVEVLDDEAIASLAAPVADALHAGAVVVPTWFADFAPDSVTAADGRRIPVVEADVSPNLDHPVLGGAVLVSDRVAASDRSVAESIVASKAGVDDATAERLSRRLPSSISSNDPRLPAPNSRSPLGIALATGAAAVLVLAIALVLTALDRAERVRERATLRNLGASPAHHRRAAAFRAALLVGVGAIPATISGVTAAWVASNNAHAMPWLWLLAGVVCFPLLAALPPWFAARRDATASVGLSAAR